jgi:pyruvate dehydrogenase E1 component beta subunit
MSDITLLEAINLALHHEMARDPDVVVLGEDVGVNGGVFRATVGLRDKFGFKRVIDTPLAEGLIAGVAVGMATRGSNRGRIPVPGLHLPGHGADHLPGGADAKPTRGRITCPIVYRSPYGAGIHSPEHHSESVEALFAHIPGLRVVIPEPEAGLWPAAVGHSGSGSRDVLRAGSHLSLHEVGCGG